MSTSPLIENYLRFIKPNKNMKRGIFLSIVLFIILVTFVAAQQGEFSVRFHSFGKNATIDLKKYLGESELYLVSRTENVIVDIDQEKGIATLRARPRWEGSEVIHFRTNESLSLVNETEEVAKFLEAVPEILFLRRIRDEELVKLFEGTIDPSILDVVKQIKREEIRKLSSEIEEHTIKIRINDEVDLKLEMGYIPAVSMDFSLGPEQEVEEEEGAEEEEEGLKVELSREAIIIILSAIGIVCFYFYIKYSKKRGEEREELVIERTISRDIKQLSLHKLRTLQRNLGKESSGEFINLFREFFSRYFGIGYDFEFKQLVRRVNDSDLSRHIKSEIKNFLSELEKRVYYPSEEWTEVYGKGQLSDKDLKKLIRQLKKIIRHL